MIHNELLTRRFIVDGICHKQEIIYSITVDYPRFEEINSQGRIYCAYRKENPGLCPESENCPLEEKARRFAAEIDLQSLASANYIQRRSRMKTSTITRATKETDIKLTLTLCADEPGLRGGSGVGFFDHMLSSFCVHGGFAIDLTMSGDLYVDAHHTVEDVGITLARAFRELIGNARGIARFGSAFIPMDESLAHSVIDISGRAYLRYDAEFSANSIGGYDTQLTREFFAAFSRELPATLHISLSCGENDHHKTEAIFKSAAYAIRAALAENGTSAIPSAKGII